MPEVAERTPLTKYFIYLYMHIISVALKVQRNGNSKRHREKKQFSWIKQHMNGEKGEQKMLNSKFGSWRISCVLPIR
jgi:hypothetical protein